MNRFIRWGLVLSAIPLAACSQRAMMAGPAGGMTAPPAVTAPAPLGRADSIFVAQAAEAGMAEAQTGELALQRAERPAVRHYAQQMVDQHAPLNAQLMRIAHAHGMTPPARPGPAYHREMRHLERSHDGAFDREYLRSQIADHRAVVALFQREAHEGHAPDLRNFAEQTLPMLREHLHEAESLAGHHPARHTHRH